MVARRLAAWLFPVVTCAIACLSSAQEKVIYSFADQVTTQSGLYPVSGVVFDAKGNLFGISYFLTARGFSDGSVFELTPAQGKWNEKEVYRFEGGYSDGTPVASPVIDNRGNLYWTVLNDAENPCGFVYGLTRESGGTWEGKTLHAFGDSHDGCMPLAALIIDSKGNLYGTTSGGGKFGKGAAFELSPKVDGNWTEKVIWSFKGFPLDGSDPRVNLTLASNGNLYGTTLSGSASSKDDEGTVFELTPKTEGSWSEKVIYSFKNVSDAAGPNSGLVFDAKGNLYGTTSSGGKAGEGAIFEFSPGADGNWTEKILYSFDNFTTNPGVQPEGNLIFDSKGNLFGTTAAGGDAGGGVVFRLSPTADGDWLYRIIYDFPNNPEVSDDADGPYAGPTLDRSGNLFGTTESGGEFNQGAVFEIANADRTEAPVFSIPGGTYTSTKTVSLSDDTSDATIYYTTNGDNPGPSSTRYTKPIKVDKSETIKAIATSKALLNSAVVTERFSIEIPADAEF
jgi:uncharacterized repeat protein (TIGR03803 family)